MSPATPSPLAFGPVIPLLFAASALGADVSPAALWRLDRVARGELVPDLAGRGLHLTAHGRPTFDIGPLGPAMVFDGATTSLSLRSAGPLVMTDALTVDAWVRLEAPVDGQKKNVVDKSGERYRLEVVEDGRVHFGLKSIRGEHRVDIYAPALAAETWHRLTAVFSRPRLELYVDGRLAAKGKWDHEVGPGGALHVGAQAGRHFPFRGRIAAVAIYASARPPRADDVQRLRASARGVPTHLSVRRSAGRVTVDTGPMQFVLDTAKTGAIESVRLGDKQVVGANVAPPFSGMLLESTQYDGWRDLAAGRRVVGRYRFTDAHCGRTSDRFTAEVRGELDFGAGDRIVCRAKLEARAGEAEIGVGLRLEPKGDFTNRFVHELAFELPLSLDWRKRVLQGADQGLHFDTRYFYQFHTSTVHRLLAEPDTNQWRQFAVDQLTPDYGRLWRAESQSTSSLTMHHGRRLAGWMGAYDRQGGMLFALRAMAERAPKSLRVAAAGGGRARVLLHPRSIRAFSPTDAEANERVFGVEHRTDWVFFKGDYLLEEPERVLARRWGVKRLASDPPVRPEPIDGRVKLWAGPAAPGAFSPIVSGGVPVARGVLRDSNQARLMHDGLDVPLQAKALAYWPDRSIKWLLLSFPLCPGSIGPVTPGAGAGRRLPFDVTLRRGGPVHFELIHGQGVRAASVARPIAAKRTGDRVTIDTGPLQLQLGVGREWLAGATLDGRPMLGAPVEGFVDFLRPKGTHPVETAHAEGEPDPGPVAVEKIDVEEAGPLRAVVRLEGKSLSSEPARVVLRVTAYAGRPFVRLAASVEFLHKDPRRAFVRRMGVRVPLRLQPNGRRVTVGGQDGPVSVPDARRAGLLHTAHTSYEVWRQADETPVRSVHHRAHRSRGWMDVSDSSGGLTVVQRDMWQECPKELLAERDPGALTAYFWPESAPLMDVRRYSNLPHQSQGESVRDRNDWVEKHYYPNDPFVGVSKTHDLLLAFHGADTRPEQIDALAADFQSRPLVYAGAGAYRQAGVTFALPTPDEATFGRTDAALANVVDFLLFHQRFWGWYGLWDHGDVRHQFRRGYGWVLPPDALAEALNTADTARQAQLVRRHRTSDYAPMHEWAYDNGRWGWTNTEGLPGQFLQMEYLRTGRRDVFEAMEAMARHVRDVDMRHAGKWFGHGTRHGVQHWSDGNHEERQTTHSEFRFHHYLTGDMRSRDFADELTRGWYTRGRVAIHASHSGRLQGLLTRWEMTGDERLGRMLRDYVHCFCAPEGIAISPQVRFPEATAYGPAREANGASMFHHHFGAAHALLEYHHLTGDPKLRDAIVRTADHAIRVRNIAQFCKYVAFAARHAPDPKPYRTALRDWAARNAHPRFFQMVTADRRHWTGPTAYLYSAVPGLFFWVNGAYGVMDALGAEPTPSAKQLEAMAKRERTGSPRGLLRGRWQSEYDRPEFAKYLNPPLKK